MTSIPPSSSLTYSDCGVDIDKGNALVDRIKPLAARTSRSGVMGSIGGFGGLFDIAAAGYKDPILVSATDGVGTKLKLAVASGIHHGIGIDLVAMCVNDLIVQGAQPLFFLDYFASSALDVEVAEQVISGIADGCKQAGCALLGGETAEMPGVYQDGDYDLAGFAVGAVERDHILPRQDIMEGDVVLGLASGGFHSNGYSLVRRVVEQGNFAYGDEAPFAANNNDGSSKGSLGELLLTPTRIYVKSCLAAIDQGGVKALAHITGGGIIDNIPRILPESVAVTISRDSWEIPPIFSWLQREGSISDDEMLRTFNCGIGMVIICDADSSDKVKNVLEAAGETVFALGAVTPRETKPVIFV